MNPNDRIEELLKATRYEPGSGARDRILNRAYEAMDQTDKSGPDVIRAGVWRITMKTRNMKIAVAAAVILIVLGGVTFRPFGHSEKGQWWLGPPAAWGQVITDSLDRVQALVYRERYVFVGDYGYTHVSGNWSRWYKTPERLRRDKFYDDTLVSTMWEVPQDVGSVLRYDVSFEYECYTVETYESRPTPSDPVEMLLFYVGLLDQADRVLGTDTFEGKECVGFEISPAKYGHHPDTWIDRIWFDTTTGLPVRIEHHGIPVTGHPEETTAFVQDEFEYYVDVPVEKFEPQVPEGFANTHPDNIRAARELEEKGKMVFADVPEGLKDRLLAALDQTDVVAYREGEQTQTYLSRHAWRQDHFAGDQLRSTEWYVIEQEQATPTSLDFNDDSFRLVHTTVDYPDRTYKVVTHTREGRPQHPMDSIRSLIGYLDRADRILDNEVIDGIECFGLELSAKKYGTNPDGMVHRFWFDADTDLPVRIEFEFISQPSGRKTVQVKDQFTWNPDLPDDFFVPQIPADFEPAGD
jgi:outer membrane lipoprotein-sorting protein